MSDIATIAELPETLTSLIQPLSVISRSDQSILLKVCHPPGTQNFFACLKITSAKMSISNVEEILKIVQRLKHPHIIKYHKVITSSASVFAVMDFFSHGSVDDRLRTTKRPFPLKLTRVWFGQILGAIDYIHSRGMAHRNLKLTSFLVMSDEHVTLSGFNHCCLAYKRELDIMRTTLFTCNITYRAPEMHAICSSIWPYDAKAADMYALGICLFQMVNLKPPFDEKLYERDQVAYINKQRNREYTFQQQYEAHYNSKIKQLIQLLLEPKPGVRTTAKDALVHCALLPE